MIFVLMTTTTEPNALPLVHVCRVIIISYFKFKATCVTAVYLPPPFSCACPKVVEYVNLSACLLLSALVRGIGLRIVARDWQLCCMYVFPSRFWNAIQGRIQKNRGGGSHMQVRKKTMHAYKMCIAHIQYC